MKGRKAGGSSPGGIIGAGGTAGTIGAGGTTGTVGSAGAGTGGAGSLLLALVPLFLTYCS